MPLWPRAYTTPDLPLGPLQSGHAPTHPPLSPPLLIPSGTSKPRPAPRGTLCRPPRSLMARGRLRYKSSAPPRHLPPPSPTPTRAAPFTAARHSPAAATGDSADDGRTTRASRPTTTRGGDARGCREVPDLAAGGTYRAVAGPTCRRRAGNPCPG